MKIQPMKHLVWVALCCMVLPLFASPKKDDKPTDQIITMASLREEPKKAVSDNDKALAEYVFIEAQNQKQKGNYDQYFELLRHAHAIDPTNSTVTYYLGYCLLAFEDGSGDFTKLGLDMMGEHFKDQPDDYHASLAYGSLNRRVGLDSVALEVWKELVKQKPGDPDIMFHLADTYAALGDFPNAIATYDSLELSVGINSDVVLRKVNVHMQLNDTTKAINEVQRIVDSAPNNGRCHVYKALVMHHFAKDDSALACFNTAQKLSPDDGEINFSMARFYEEIGDSVNYDAQISKALVSPSLSIEEKLDALYAFSAKLMRDKSNFERAHQLFDVMIEQHPYEAPVRNLYAQFLAANKMYSEAAKHMQFAVNADPSQADYWGLLISLYAYDGEFTEAIKAGNKALEHLPDNEEIMRLLGNCYYQNKEYDKAIQSYDKALAVIDSTDLKTRSIAYSGRADALFSKGDTIAAFDTYEEALKMNPGDVSIMNNYAYFLTLARKDLEKAESMSAMTIKAEPENPTYLDTYAWIFFCKGEYKIALMYIENALKNDPESDSWEEWDHYGDILFMNQRYDEAVEKWKKALELEPTNERLKRKVELKTYVPQ